MKIAAALVLALSLSAFAAEKPKAASVPGQPAVETLDLETIARIRDEGINHSHIMEYASGLFDALARDSQPRLIL